MTKRRAAAAQRRLDQVIEALDGDGSAVLVPARPTQQEKSLGKHVLASVVRPSRGRPYTRCPECKAQVFAPEVMRQQPIGTLAYVLRALTLTHIKENHEPA